MERAAPSMQAELPASVTRIRCNHLQDAESAAVFARIATEADRLDVLVNAAWGVDERMVEDGRFTWQLPFWEQPPHRWTGMLHAGVRAAFVASAHAALARDPALMERTGKVAIAAEIAAELGVTGRRWPPTGAAKPGKRLDGPWFGRGD
jgi:NAD(P)-dependent dehydrogenase (short-subunit alcohol dehydrogenase family)